MKAEHKREVSKAYKPIVSLFCKVLQGLPNTFKINSALDKQVFQDLLLCSLLSSECQPWRTLSDPGRWRCLSLNICPCSYDAWTPSLLPWQLPRIFRNVLRPVQVRLSCHASQSIPTAPFLTAITFNGDHRILPSCPWCPHSPQQELHAIFPDRSPLPRTEPGSPRIQEMYRMNKWMNRKTDKWIRSIDKVF